MESYLNFIYESGIKKGDILDVSSDLKEIILFCRKYKEKFSPDAIIEALKDMVSNEGTILIRAFNWDFCHDLPFDIKNTPSRVGALGNIALKRSDFIRSQHPLYSFCVWGKYQKEIIELSNKSAFGADSPFGFITRHNGKQFMYGANMYNSLTFVHYVEEQTGVSYRYLKDFTGRYVNYEGKEEIRTYSMNVRNLDLNIRMFNENTANLFEHTFEEIFLEKGILKEKHYDNVFVGLLNLPEAYKIIEDDILHNRSKKICLYNGQ